MDYCQSWCARTSATWLGPRAAAAVALLALAPACECIIGENAKVSSTHALVKCCHWSAPAGRRECLGNGSAGWLCPASCGCGPAGWVPEAWTPAIAAGTLLVGDPDEPGAVVSNGYVGAFVPRGLPGSAGPPYVDNPASPGRLGGALVQPSPVIIGCGGGMALVGAALAEADVRTHTLLRCRCWARRYSGVEHVKGVFAARDPLPPSQGRSPGRVVSLAPLASWTGTAYVAALSHGHGLREQPQGNFNIILVHLTRVCQPSTTPLAPCAMFYLVSILTGC